MTMKIFCRKSNYIICLVCMNEGMCVSSPHSDELLRTLTDREFTGLHQWFPKKISVTRYHEHWRRGTNHGRPWNKCAKCCYVWSGRCKFISVLLLGQIWKISMDTVWNYIRNTSAKQMTSKFGFNFHKRCYQRNIK